MRKETPLTCLRSTTQVWNLSLRTQLPKSGALSTISLFPERVVFRTPESELGSGGEKKQIPGWRQGLGTSILKTASGNSAGLRFEDHCPRLPLQ